MNYANLINVIQENNKFLAYNWFDKIKSTSYLDTYKSLPNSELLRRGEIFFENLGIWLEAGSNDDAVEIYFENVGYERQSEGFPLEEVQHAIFVGKNVTWQFLFEENQLSQPQSKEEAISLMSLLNSYFDQGAYFVIRGFLRGLIDKLEMSDKFTDEEIQELLNFSNINAHSVKTIKAKLFKNVMNKGILR